MERQIALIRRKMIGLVTLLACLAVWQREFIIEGIKSHVEVTSVILLTFAFSIVVSFVFTFKLRNEVIAFKALKEMWEDIQMGPAESVRDPLWRHHRCGAPASVFQRPRLLGHAYELVTEELARTKKIRLSVETMNTLVHDIELAINDEKSLIVYLSGLLVFMGLIGTFIGLLHMVGSIGGIIGSLASTSGGAGASAAFGELLAKLQEPLRGMASGFAASLFGLFSSLVVGLLGRFAGQAAGVLKSEFKSWAAGVVRIGEDEIDGGHLNGAAAPGEARLLAMVGHVLSDYARVAGSFDQAARLLQDMRVVQDAQAGATERVADEIARMHKTQTRILEEIAGRPSAAPALRELAAGAAALGETLSRRMEAEMSGMRETIQEAGRAQGSNMRLLSANHQQTAAQLSEAIGSLSAEIDRRAAAAIDPARVEAALDRGLKTGVGHLTQAVEGKIERLETLAARLAGEQSRALAELAESSRNQGADARVEKVGRAVEAGLADGFARVGQTMETAFSAYSSLLHVTMAALERGRETRAESDDDAHAAPGEATSAPITDANRRRA